MKHRKTLLTMFALLLALALGGCGGGADSGRAASNGADSTPAGQSQSEPAEPSGSTSAPAEGADVTARYQEQLTGCYGGEHDLSLIHISMMPGMSAMTKLDPSST